MLGTRSVEFLENWWDFIMLSGDIILFKEICYANLKINMEIKNIILWGKIWLNYRKIQNTLPESS
jgi:hypothetical protein